MSEDRSNGPRTREPSEPHATAEGAGHPDFFRRVVEQSPNGVLVTDLDRKVVYANAAAAEILEREPDDIIGGSASSFYPESNAYYGVDLEALHAGERPNREIDLRRVDGTTVPVIAAYRLGDPGTIIEIWVDQSWRRRLEKMKSDFVYVAAHELRNPVTAMQLLLDIIFEDKRLDLQPVLRNYLLKMTDANQRLLQLVDDLLEVSRSDAGKLKLDIVRTDIVDEVRSVLNEVMATALARDLTVTYEPAPNVPEVMADKKKVHEIISNLLSNAIKYNVAQGSVTVSHDVKDGMVETHVADTGIGIRKEDLGNLFSKLWRSDDKAVRAQAGTGLGLFIVKELVERMGGSVRVSSEYGKGTTISFSLPVAKE